jgi:hypothetical protein
MSQRYCISNDVVFVTLLHVRVSEFLLYSPQARSLKLLESVDMFFEYKQVLITDLLQSIQKMQKTEGRATVPVWKEVSFRPWRTSRQSKKYASSWS